MVEPYHQVTKQSHEVYGRSPSHEDLDIIFIYNKVKGEKTKTFLVWTESKKFSWNLCICTHNSTKIFLGLSSSYIAY